MKIMIVMKAVKAFIVLMDLVSVIAQVTLKAIMTLVPCHKIRWYKSSILAPICFIALVAALAPCSYYRPHNPHKTYAYCDFCYIMALVIIMTVIDFRAVMAFITIITLLKNIM